MKVLSLFSGIGAFEKALDRLNVPYQLVNYCEIDKYASNAYAQIHQCDESLNLGDITKIDTSTLPNDIDLITYGFPCQDISLAGKQKGFEEDGELTRSGLFFEALRIIEDTKPRVAIAENVKNLTSQKFQKEFDIVLTSLEEAGYNNYWKVLNAKDYGIPQNRERVFIVSIRKDIDNEMFKFPEEFELKLRLKDMLEDEVDEKYYLSDKKIEKILAWKAYQKPFERVLGNNSVCPTLTARGAGEDHSGMIILDKSLNDTTNLQESLLIREKTKKGFKEAFDGDGVYINRPHQKRGVVQRGMIQTLKTSCSDVAVVIGSTQKNAAVNHDGICPTLTEAMGKGGGHVPMHNYDFRIRKLTPLECFRLMGFSDEDFNKIVGISNTQLYKMAGNSIVVNVLVHIFKSLFEALETNEHKEIIEQPALFEIDRGEVIMEGIKEEKQTNGSMIKWNEIDSLIGKPVFDKGNETWRVLAGYKRIADEFFVAFTDYDGFEDIDLNCTNLYRNEETAYKK